jgi:RNA polymerase sigma factor (sigma-70 family)
MSEDISKKYQNQVSAIRENDEKALKLFYQSNYPKVEKYVLENNGSVDEAKDIFQEAFIAVWRNIQLDRFKLQQQSSLDGYLYQVAKYKWIDQLRRNKNRNTHLTVAIEEPLVILEQEEENYLEKVKLHYAAIGEPCRSVLYRFYFLKQTMSEIAVAFSWTEPTAKNNKYRCLQKLRSMVLSKTKSIEIRK